MAISTRSSLTLTCVTELTEPEGASCNGAAVDTPASSVPESWKSSHSKLSSRSSASTLPPCLSSNGSFVRSECSTDDCSEQAYVEAKRKRSVRFSDASDEIHEIPQWMRRRAKWEEDLMEFLFRQGFSQDVNSQKLRLFRTTTFPLHVACKLGNLKMVKLLLAYGADKNLRDSRTRMPADIARRYNGRGSHDAILRALEPEGCRAGRVSRSLAEGCRASRVSRILSV
mmetsp:Transcript_74654/g.192651  ORF Transcript_74654/g.192651 Transcript_74654/m.192651 type:complete len:227 (-) Transcript_74654:370-1050(-)